MVWGGVYVCKGIKSMVEDGLRAVCNRLSRQKPSNTQCGQCHIANYYSCYSKRFCSICPSLTSPVDVVEAVCPLSSPQ